MTKLEQRISKRKKEDIGKKENEIRVRNRNSRSWKRKEP